MGPESQFERFLGYYVAAFHLDHHPYNIGTSLIINEEPRRSLWTYSLGKGMLSAMFIFKHENLGYVPPEKRLPLLKEAYQGAGWIAGTIPNDVTAAKTVFFDSTIQIVMPSWSKGRVALLGDACACLTLLAGQGSHLAMAEAYVIATELDRYADEHRAPLLPRRKNAEARDAREAKSCRANFKVFCAVKALFYTLRRMVERLFFSDAPARAP